MILILQDKVMSNLPQWPNYGLVQYRERVWHSMCHYFLLRLWNWYIGNYNLCTFSQFLQNSNPIFETKVMMIFPRSLVWDEIMEPTKNLTSIDHISTNIVKKVLKFLHEVPHDFGFSSQTIQLLNVCIKKIIAKIPRWAF